VHFYRNRELSEVAPDIL